MPNLGTQSALERYQEAEQYILSLITGPPTPEAGTPADIIRDRAIERLERMRAFLEFLDDPHLAYKTLHIGGTSGKGSTATLAASILTASGFRTGLHVSPYLQVATEKLVVDGEIASAERYNDIVADLAGRANAWISAGNPPLTYGEFWVALTFQYFAEEAVDVAVIEVGAGGRFDLTNVIEPEAVAITSIGLDHMATLGSTVEEIAWHKAGIIKPGTIAVTAVSAGSALEVIRNEAVSVGSELIEVGAGHTFDVDATGAFGTRFTDLNTGTSFTTSLAGQFQAANAAVALALTRSFDAHAVTDETAADGLRLARFPGRLEIVQETPLVLLDGAHNPQKIEGLVSDLRHITGDRRVTAVFGALESKNHGDMLRALAPNIDLLVLTAPEVYAKPPVDPAELADAAAAFNVEIHIELEPVAAVNLALDLASDGDAVLVTGSLYLVGNVRERWFPSEDILVQGTMWPST